MGTILDKRNSIFVYGTLLQGESNSTLLRGAEFVGKSKTKPEFELVDFGPYPAMIPDGNTAIKGEVYLVDNLQLARIDRLEGYPGFYRRVKIELHDGTPVYAYLLSRAQVTGLPTIPSGDWQNRQQQTLE